MKNIYLLFFAMLASFGLRAQASMNVNLLYHWEDTTIAASAAFDNVYNEVWGFVQDGVEYGVIGSSDGTHIFDLSDPANATMVAYIPGAAQGPQIIHRDYHDYNGFLYMVCDEGPSTLQIADLSHLPDSAPVVYESNTFFQRSHNIFIDPDNAKLYSCGSGYQLKVLSLANPIQPTELLNCNTDVPFWSSEVQYCHDIYVRNDTAYINAPDIPGLFVVDFSDINNVQLVGSLTDYPQKGYNHSGWLHQSGDYYALADETHGTEVKIVDLSDLNNISTISTLGSGVDDSLSIIHNLIYRDNFLYVSHYHDGFYIFNMFDPTNPVITGFYDTSTEPNGPTFKGAWGVYPLLPSGIVVVSDMQNGLYVFDVGDAVSTPELSPEEQSVKVFPNPFRENLNVHLEDFREPVAYELVNLQGQRVSSGTLRQPQSTIRLNGELSSGIYFLRLNSGKFAVVRPVIRGARD